MCQRGNNMKEKEEKARTTFYLTQSSFEKLNKMCAGNVIEGKKMGRSAIVSEAIELLYKTVKK